MLIYNGQVIAGGGTIVLPMTRAEYEANKAVLDTADVWVDLTDEPDQVATADQIAYSVDNVQKSMGYIGDIATKAVAKVEPTDTALYLHEVGEYFINKDGNACKTDVQISVGGTIILGTNCHVLPNGVANDINSNLTHKTVATSDNKVDSKIITKINGIVYFTVGTTALTSGSNVILTVTDFNDRPSYYSSWAPSAYPHGSVDRNKLIMATINSSGELMVEVNDNTTYGVQISGCYVANTV